MIARIDELLEHYLMKRFAFILVFLLSLTNPVLAARWAETAEGSNGSIFYTDMDSLYQANDGNIISWRKTVYKNIKNIPGETLKYNGQRVWYSLELTGENCQNNTITTGYQATYYGLQGQVLHSTSADLLNPAQTEQIVPETVGESTHKFICWYWNTLKPAIDNTTNNGN